MTNIRRDRLVARYLEALDDGDFDQVGAIILAASAMNDNILDQMIRDANSEYVTLMAAALERAELDTYLDSGA